jgi:hypothetical protein
VNCVPRLAIALLLASIAGCGGKSHVESSQPSGGSSSLGGAGGGAGTTVPGGTGGSSGAISLSTDCPPTPPAVGTACSYTGNLCSYPIDVCTSASFVCVIGSWEPAPQLDGARATASRSSAQVHARAEQ